MRRAQTRTPKSAPLLLVFFDIVNWKLFRTTNEALLIDPDNARNVGFFYERHDRDPALSLRNLWALLTDSRDNRHG